MKTSILSARGWRVTAIVFGVVVALLLAAYAALTWAFPTQRLSALLADEVKSKTGRDFRIGGGLSIRLLPRIAVVAEDVAIGNAAWGSRPDMVTLRRAAFEVSLWPLLHGVVHVLSVDVQGADVLLESDARGRANWLFGPPASSPAAASSPASAAGDATAGVDLDRITVADARITYRGAAGEKPLAVSIESLAAGNQGDRVVVEAAFSEGQQRWRFEGETGRLVAWTSGVADWPFDLRLSGDGAKLSAVGSLPGAGRAGATRAAVKVHIDKAAALVPWVGDAAARLVPFDAEATLQHNADVLKAEALRLSIAGQSITGHVTVRTGGKVPSVEATLAAASIDLSHWLGGTSHAAAQPGDRAPPRAPLFSDTPLPPVVLPKFPLHADVRVERLVIPGMPALAKLAAQIKSEPDRLIIEPLSLAIADGDVRGRLDLTARGNEPLRVAVRLNANALSLQALDVPGTGGPRFRGGRANAQVNLNLAGHTPRALAASSDGRALVSVSDVTLAGGAAAAMERNVLVTLLDALLPKREANQSTTISCAVFNLPLHNGVARINRTIAFETSQLAVAASGELNLAAQTVALGFQPTAKKGLGLNPASLAQLVSLRGPLQDPGVGIDVQGTTREAARIGAAVATGGLTLIGSRMLAKSEDTEVCRYAAASSAATPSPAAAGQRR